VRLLHTLPRYTGANDAEVRTWLTAVAGSCRGHRRAALDHGRREMSTDVRRVGGPGPPECERSCEVALPRWRLVATPAARAEHRGTMPAPHAASPMSPDVGVNADAGPRTRPGVKC
jgi:hypothetical protein